MARDGLRLQPVFSVRYMSALHSVEIHDSDRTVRCNHGRISAAAHFLAELVNIERCWLSELSVRRFATAMHAPRSVPTISRAL